MKFNKDSIPKDKAFIDSQYAKLASKEKNYFGLVGLYLIVMVGLMVLVVITNDHSWLMILSAYLFLYIPLIYKWVYCGLSKNDFQYMTGHQEVTIVEKIDLTKTEIKSYFEAVDRLGRTITRGEYKAILAYQEDHYYEEKLAAAHNTIYR